MWLSGKDLVLASNCRAGSNTQFDDGGLKTSESQENAAEEEPVIVEEISEYKLRLHIDTQAQVCSSVIVDYAMLSCVICILRFLIVHEDNYMFILSSG